MYRLKWLTKNPSVRFGEKVVRKIEYLDDLARQGKLLDYLTSFNYKTSLCGACPVSDYLKEQTGIDLALWGQYITFSGELVAKIGDKFFEAVSAYPLTMYIEYPTDVDHNA